jgi:FHS family L-fucose permease-like MFS transporter
MKRALYVIYSIYFFCGLAQCFESVFLPEFKSYFQLSYTQQMYTLFAKSIPFTGFPILIGLFIKRVGYRNSIALSLLIFSIGTALIIPGLRLHHYTLVLAAFFILGLGFNMELVAGNPLLARLGKQEESASRLNIGNALGAVAQIIAPLFVTLIIPVSVIHLEEKLRYAEFIFGATAGLLAIIALITFRVRSLDLKQDDRKATQTYSSKVWSLPQVWVGFIAIFLILGVEGGIFGLYRNYLEEPGIAGLTSRQSQTMFTVYFAVFAAGRLAGSYIQKRVSASSTIIVALFISIVLLIAATMVKGTWAVICLTSLGFFISIFFPTLYALAIEGLGERTAEVSGILTMGFLGGAILPVVQGKLADEFGLASSFIMGILPYGFALFYVWQLRRKQVSLKTII